MNRDRFNILISQYILGEISDTELEELEIMLSSSESALWLDDEMRKHFIHSVADTSLYDRNRLHKLVTERMPGHDFWENETATVNERTNARRPYLRWAAVLAFVLCCSLAVYFLIDKDAYLEEHVRAAASTAEVQDIPPGSNKAVLTLGDGTTIDIDDSKKGKLAQQGNANIVKVDDGQLNYEVNSKVNTTITYNTLSTPRGGQFQLTLSDGTRVWLNAASSIRYPTQFSGNERRVEITGEAYFEVSHNERLPFIVGLSESASEILVLGTVFNVNSYADELSVNTTLLEGSVSIKHDKTSVLLKPGEQAQVAGKINPGAGSVKIVKDADLAQVTAWKDGVFSFHNAGLREVMRQCSRWYNIDVIYEGDVPDIEFGGRMGRDVSLSKLLYFFKGSDLHFRIENGNKLIITQ